MSTSAERTARVTQENRVVYITGGVTPSGRTVRVPQESRTVTIERLHSSAERTVYATED